MSVALATVIVTHKPGFMLTMMAVVALRNMDRDKLLKVYLRTWIVGLVAVALLVKAGIVEDVTKIDERGYFRHGAGFCTGNCYHSAFVILYGLYFFYRRGKAKWWEVIIAELLNIAVLHFSGSITGATVGMALPIIMYAVGIINSLCKGANNQIFFKLYSVLLCLIMIIILCVSFIWPLMIQSDPYVSGVWYSSFTGRLKLAREAFLYDPITLFGYKDNNIMLDNAYVYIFFQFGILPFILVVLMFGKAIASLIRKKDIYALSIIAIFVAYGYMEQFFNATFMNFTWIIIGCEIMDAKS